MLTIAKASAQFVPYLTTEAGLALTQADWAAQGVKHAVFDLATLLVKPGVEVLSQVPALAEFMNWPDQVILDATRLMPDSTGAYCVRSPYDGRLHRIALEEWLSLVEHLRVHVLILRSAALAQALLQLPNSIELVLALDEGCVSPPTAADLEGLSGVLIPQNALLCAEFSKRYPDLMIYVAGALMLPQMQEFLAAGAHRLLSDVPAQDALQGQVYGANGVSSVTDRNKALEFTCLDTTCVCPTCIAGFTCAYLHHLYEHTPGLCQRLLIQHNVHYVVHNLKINR